MKRAVLIPTKTSSQQSQDEALPTLSLPMPHFGNEASHNNSSTNSSDFLALGRNGITRIVNPQMSRRLAKVQWTTPTTSTAAIKMFVRSPTLIIRAVAGAQGITRVNETILMAEDQPHFLKDGDVISLESPDSTKYQYRLEIISEQTTNVQSSCSSSFPSNHVQPTTAIENRHHHHKEQTQEFSCAICLDIMVEPVTAVPCGHSFCKECLSISLQQCPTCCTDFQCQPFPSRSLNHAIELLVDLQPHLFAQDDVRQYLSRTKRLVPVTAAAFSSSSSSSPSSRKRARRIIPESSGKSIGDAIVID